MSLKETKNMSRGRPPATRARVLGYIEKHKPETIMQIVRATGADRRHIYRILAAAYGANFRSTWKLSKDASPSHAALPIAA